MTRIEHTTFRAGWTRLILLLVTSAASLLTSTARAGIQGETGPDFDLTATAGYISVADGGSIYSWGYTSNGTMQLPGPTLIVNEGDTVTVTLTNNLPAAAGNVSIVFPGHAVTATDGVEGDLAQERRRRARHDGARFRNGAANATVRCADAHAPGRKAAGACRWRRTGDAPVPHTRQPRAPAGA